MSQNTIIILNGHLQDKVNKYKKLIPKNAFLLAADGGALLLRKIGFLPHTIIGDMDSLSEKNLKYFNKKNIKLIRYPVEKDETDAELALDYCWRNNLNNIIITGALGGRFDQQMANIFLLEYASKLNLKAVIKEPGLEIGLVKEKKLFENKNGFKLSLMPIDDIVKNVFIKGCKYKLDGKDLCRHKTRGISNKITNKKAVVEKEKGNLLYVLTE